MSKDTENQREVTNSYTSITRLSGPSKIACAKCDAKKLPICVCSKSGSEENESEEKSSAPIEKTKNSSSMQHTSNFPTDKDLILIKQDLAQKIESITHEENSQSFNPSPFSMTLTPFNGD